MTDDGRQPVRRSPPTQRLVRRAGLGEVGKTENGGPKTDDRGRKTAGVPKLYKIFVKLLQIDLRLNILLGLL